ncbi:MAG TPA: hypothetical protein VFQ51_05540, partial [Vicinamibacteria bacterium]|nr:hypothetical protein [Vicinamibacteria bacterium]
MAFASPKDKKQKKDQTQAQIPATGEEDSDVPTPPSRLPAPAARPQAGKSLSQVPQRQAAYPAVPGTQVTVVPGARYAAGGLRTLVLGQHYRRTWTTPVSVPVLDLAAFGGGLKPLKKGGGKQTLSLTFEAGDGHRYKFRTLDKDPTPSLAPALRGTTFDAVVQDQISASHPGALLVADGLSEAARLLHVSHRMFVMPDDDRLGEFRQEFGGQLGYVEMVPDEEHPMPPGFEGVTKVVESDTLVDRIDNDPKERIDARSYLKGRLFDIFLGDWDRHQHQWEWVRQGGDDAKWEAYPKDRDMAFIDFDGLAFGFLRGSNPMLVRFGPLYPSLLGLAWNSRVFDRRLLSGLERPVYQEVARELQQGLTDDAIVAAVHRLPPEWFAIDGERWITALKSRRDRLPEEAEVFYRLLAGEVELHGTNAAETVEVRREEPGSVLVVMRNDGDGEPLLQRRFKDG